MSNLTKKDLEKIINKQLRMAGFNIRFKQLEEQKKHMSNWYTFLYISSKKEEKFKKWLSKFFKRKFGKIFSEAYIEDQTGWFLLQYGLRTYDGMNTN